jgi:EAL domain-containing protein (putative c-di-GMP-specific phosphodiesterase class I)
MDQRLIVMLTDHPEMIGGKSTHLNLSVLTVSGSIFAQFMWTMPRIKRNLICFELHRGDLLQDFPLTLGAIDVLRREGFKVAIDGVTPDIINYINLQAFDVDYIKINVSKDRAAMLQDPIIRGELAKLPAEKLIFYRCDNERALAIGLELGVTLFQGWLIDDAADPRKSS